MESTISEPPKLNPCLDHFLRLARQGQHNRGASGGEKRAWRIAKALIDDCPGLDGEAVTGIGLFAAACSSHPQAVRDILGLE